MANVYTDMTGREVVIAGHPRRIVSLVPSQTELLYDLGLHEEVVGITKFCIHPQEWFRSKRRVGGTKNVRMETVDELQPDLIIANKEENTREQIEALAAKYPVWISDIQTLDDALVMIRHVAGMTGQAAAGEQIAGEIVSGFDVLHASVNPLRVAYFIWRNPWMSVGHDTFISNIIHLVGWVNALQELSRYPAIEIADLVRYDVDVVLLSSEPYPFKEQHMAEIAAILPQAKIVLVDGEMFSWYGSRLLHAPAYLQQLVHSVGGR